jgi:putative colanic acid biosynthesis acetyltransferase WcaF
MNSTSSVLTVKLDLFDNSDFEHGRTKFFRFIWMGVLAIFFNTWFPFPSTVKVFLLKLFGSKVGKGVVIRNHVRIKYPWKLSVGNNVWIGESVWIDNLAHVKIGSNVCLSQGAFLLTGNHDYKRNDFKLIIGEICLEDGVWIGAKSLVGPGVRCEAHAVLTAGSAVFSDISAYDIFQGNPAKFKRKRI